MPKQYKIDAVAEIESKIESNAGVYVVSYNGLTVLQAQELRKQLREAGAQIRHRCADAWSARADKHGAAAYRSGRLRCCPFLRG